MSNFKYTHPSYVKKLTAYTLIRDCLEGQEAVKGAGERYLPKPNKHDRSPENSERYNQYVQRALFFNATKKTHSGLVGMVVSTEITHNLDKSPLELMLNNADGENVSLSQQCKKALDYVLGYGRAGILSDYPHLEDNSKQFVDTNKVTGIVKVYSPFSIINWRTRIIQGIKKLVLVVLEEQHLIDNDGFETKFETRYKVLKLDENGIYQVEIYSQDDEGGQINVEYSTPTRSDGSYFTNIPFTFVGSLNNDENPDNPPIYDLAVVNIAHYRNSAEYEDSVFMIGQPTPYVSGLTEKWIEITGMSKVYLGSNTTLMLPVGGQAGLIQAAPNGLSGEAMLTKEKMMVALGAKLVENKAVQRTLGEARMEQISENSILAMCAINVSKAMSFALNNCLQFVDVSSDLDLFVSLSNDFSINRLTTQERQQLIAEWQGGAISFREMRHQLINGGVAIEKDNDLIKAEIDAEMSASVGAVLKGLEDE